MEKEKINWIIVLSLTSILLVSHFTFFVGVIPPDCSCPSPQVPSIDLSVTSHEDSWVLEVESITSEGENLSLSAKKVFLSGPHLIELTDIQDTWCYDYGIIWNDEAGDGMFSEGETIVILKEGGQEGGFSPGDEILIGLKHVTPPVMQIGVTLPNDDTKKEYFGLNDTISSKSSFQSWKVCLDLFMPNTTQRKEGIS